MTKHKLHAHIVLDRSGSMYSAWDDTLGAVNTYVAELAKDDKIKPRISLTVFDTEGVDLIRHKVKKNDWKDVTDAEVTPRSGTPLLDAIGSAIATSDATAEDITRQALIIVTDGQENSSREHTKESIKALIEERQKKEWLVIYLGANVDAFHEARGMGIHAGATMDSHTNRGLADTITVAAANTMSYGGGAGGASEGYFSDEQRKDIDEKHGEGASG